MLVCKKTFTFLRAKIYLTISPHIGQCYLWALCVLLVDCHEVGGTRVVLYDYLGIVVGGAQGLSDVCCLFILAQ